MSDLTKILLKQTGFNPHLISPDCRFFEKHAIQCQCLARATKHWLSVPSFGVTRQKLA